MLAPFLIGIAAGLRSMTPPAAVALRRHRRFVGPALALAALGELAVDKHPRAPDRTDAGAAAGRIVSGALAGAFVRGGRVSIVGGIAGAAGAVVGTRLGHRLRTRLAKRLGKDWPVAVAEDALAIGLVALAQRQR
ncbi:DUF4126 domain-containing protein [Sphingomonas qomolangmaensis]|uniref:DUF4126 domain-containing protein n=1 Tax=Sphingomonas qomolangmaensis TaxID=2918765 RepID=A0ABY5L3N3_9SPHN|nr:DUF4126 domain-containing protein [Sphingomonas qomolangmaensis]UUL81568.1 DUF4126 domain-containing protein [Sphingomonas qomolangmaensis]